MDNDLKKGENAPVHEPCRSQNVYSIQTLSTVHLSQHLIDDSIGYSSGVMSSAARKKLYHQFLAGDEAGKDMCGNEPFRSYAVKLVKEKNAWLGC